ncbi:hypothetical protein Mapa_004430 [Marchantia paleacea]|nr:hypothetical protein Mapa_004430 [Marchantia paleacea]
MALHATFSGRCVAPPCLSRLPVNHSSVNPALSTSSPEGSGFRLSGNLGCGIRAIAVVSSPKAFLEKSSAPLPLEGPPSCSSENSCVSNSKNLEQNGQNFEGLLQKPRKTWKSRTGRNIGKKYGDRMTSILETLNSDVNVERALESLKVKLDTREQSIVLNEEKVWTRALAAFAWFKKQESYRPNVFHYNIMLKILGRSQQWELVEDFWAEMQQEKILPTNVTFSTLIDVYDKAGRKDKAMEWLELMKSRGLRPDNVTTNTVLNVHKRHGNVAAAEELFRQLWIPQPQLEDFNVKTNADGPAEVSTSTVPVVDVETFNAMIDMYGRTGRFAEASKFFSDMIEANVALDTVTFNTMIKVCGLAGRLSEAEAMFMKMEDVGIISDVATYNILIAIFVKVGKLETAMEYFEKMKVNGLVPDKVTYHTLLSSLASRDRVKDAELICQEMGEAGVAPDGSASVGLVRMYVRLGLLDKGSKIVKNLLESGILGSASYAAIIDVYGEQNLWYEAELIFQGCRPKWTVEIFNTMIKAYGLCGLHERAVEVFSILEECDLVPDEITFNTLLHSAVAIVPSDLEKVESTLSRMRRINCKLQRSTSNLLIGFYAKLGMVREAEQTFRQMEGDGVPLDAECYGALLNAYAEAGLAKEAEQTVVDMKEVGFHPNKVVLTTLMKLYGRIDQLEEAKRIYMDMGRQLGTSDVFAANLLIDLYAKNGKTKEAEKVYKELEETVSFNDVTLSTMLEMYRRAGFIRQALGMATRMLRIKGLVNIGSYNSVLSLYASLGRATEAMEVFKLLDLRSVSPDIQTHTIMSGVMKSIGSVQKAIDLLTTEAPLGHSPTLQSLTSLASLYARAGYFEESFEVCNKLRHGRFSLDTAAYNALIFAFGSAGRFDESLRLFMEMQSKGLEPDAITYTTVITVYGKAGLLEGVTRIFKRMKQAGCEPSMATYKAVIDIYRDAGKVELSAMVYQEMKFTEYLRQQGTSHYRDLSLGDEV